MKLNLIGAAVAPGVFLGVWHGVWAGLVAAGWAQALVDFSFRLHFLSHPFQVQPFNFTTAAALVGVTAAIGLAGGLLFALVWNGFLGSAALVR